MLLAAEVYRSDKLTGIRGPGSGIRSKTLRLAAFRRIRIADPDFQTEAGSFELETGSSYC